MDEFVKDNLKNWNLLRFAERFGTAGIDQEIFLEIDKNNLIDELFDKIKECGHRRKFLKKLNELKVSPGQTPTINPNPAPPRTPLQDITNYLSEPSSSVVPCNAQPVVVEDMPVNDQAMVGVSIIHIAPTKITVLALFQSTYESLVILKEFEINKKLETRLISSLIISFEFKGKNYRIVEERFEEIVEQLPIIFKIPNLTPAQIIAIFYFKYQKATQNCRAIQAGGCVYVKYLNERRRLIRLGVISKNEIIAEDKALIDAGKGYIVSLLTLPKFLCRVIRKRHSTTNHELFGFTSIDLVDAFICNPQTLADFKIFKERRRSDSLESGRPIRPFISFVGNFLNDGVTSAPTSNNVDDNPVDDEGVALLDDEAPNVQATRDDDGVNDHDEVIQPPVQHQPLVQVFVTVNNIDFKIESNKLVDAVTYCFKSFAACGIKYPSKVSLVWRFLETQIFKIDRMKGKVYPKQVKISSKFSQETLDALSDIFQDSAVIFKKFDTEYKRFELYKEKQLLIDPLSFELKKYGKSSQAQHAPLRWSLKTFLEIPGNFHVMMKYKEELKNDDGIICNVMQGEYWTGIERKFENRIVLSLFFFHDDFEAGDALGSHAGQNSLGDVFRNGLILNIGKEQVHVYFQPCLEIGDNKSLNEDQGYQDHFIHGRPCRICRADMNQIKSMIQKDEALLRTIENYLEDLRRKQSCETGLLEECVFNELDDYNNLDNGGLDLMHDVFEGGGNALFINLLDDLINKQDKSKFDFLIQRIEWFNKEASDIPNKIPVIKESHLSGKSKLKMSAAEMINFIRCFGILVGDKIDRYEENESWILFLNFRKIVDILLSPRIVEGHIMQLTYLIPDFLSLCIKLYGDLFSKLHNMIHIIRVLRKFGPLIAYWAMRMEAKHRDLKNVAITTNNTVNLLKTIALRSQLQLAYTKLAGSTNVQDIEVDTCSEIDLIQRSKFFRDLKPETKVVTTTHLKFRGIEYHADTVLVIYMGDNDLLNFGPVRDIFVVENDDVLLLIQPHTNLYFNQHIHAYNVVAREALILKNVKDLPDIHPCTLIQDGDALYVVPKYIL
ncbi:hypothetical protein QAD02_000029 [Eretmocerus hayati]|uniref:Uncharacterized protein n=1 Tax=Eretmocerus hayati TaxID=131215 RepID=A0ACC2NC88_9HYME|nr:hypothetical protein QAD02_000029 [Eretmocerus hayati]